MICLNYRIHIKNMKILIIINLVLINIFLSVPVYAEDTFVLTDEEKNYLEAIQSKTYSLGITSDLNYYIDENGEASGIISPIVNLINSWGIDLEISKYGWQEAFLKLDKNELDILGLAVLNQDRCDTYACTTEIYNSSIGIYSLNNSGISSVTELEGLTVGLISNSALPSMLDVYLTPTGQLRYYNTIEALFEGLQNNEVDCVATSLTVQSELLNYENVVFSVAVDSVNTPQGLYTNNEELTPLIEILNRYLSSAQGHELIKGLNAEKRKGIIHSYRKKYSAEIKTIQDNYETIKLYDSSTLYPLSFYDSNHVYSGLQADINSLFTELTGVEIGILGLDYYASGFLPVMDDLINNKIQGAIGVYQVNKFYNHASLEYSNALVTDNLGLYVLRNADIKNDYDLKIGSIDFGTSYYAPTNNSSDIKIFNNRTELIESLNKGEINAIFTGELTVDYLYTIKNDYSLMRYNNSLVPANVNILFNKNNKELNLLMNLSIDLLSIIEPQTFNYWTNNTMNSKFETISLRSELINEQNKSMIIVQSLVFVLGIVLVVVFYQLRKFSSYDKQISKMLSVQKNMDMLWGDFKTKSIISKGNHPFINKYDLSEEEKKKLTDLSDYKEDLEEINSKKLNFSEKEIQVEHNNKKIYLKRYTHPINENKFMSLMIDISAEKDKEKELNQLANTDELTKLLNRRAMNIVLDDYIKHSFKRIFLFMFDIDDFKKVNDNYGHDIGDLVLISAAECISSKMSLGSVSRWGGEEFLAVIELDSVEEAISIGNAILNDFENTEVDVEGKTVSTTISCGIAEVENENNCEFAIFRSDKALYKAKANNKNNVQFISKQLDSSALLPTYYEETITGNRSVLISAAYNKIMGKVIHAFFFSRDTKLVIDELLRIACDAFEMDRAYLYGKKNDELVRTHIYQPNLTDIASVKNIPLNSVDWHNMDRLGSVRFVDDTSNEISENEKVFRPNDVKAYVQFPIILDDVIIGLGGFVSFKPRVWSQEDQHILTDIAGIMNEIVIRQALETQLIISNTSFRAILDSIDDIVYVTDLETKELLYANKKLRNGYNMQENDYAGKTCWEVLRPDFKESCHFCQHHLLCKDNSTVRHELYNSLANKWFDITDTMIEWEDGRKAVVMVCYDISKSKQEEAMTKAMLEELKLKTELNSFALSTAKGFSWKYDLEEKTIEFSSEISDIIGYETNYFKNIENYISIVLDEEKDDLLNKLQNYVLNKKGDIEIEHSVISQAGEIRTFFARGRFFNEEKSIVCGATLDITEMKKYEKLQQELVMNLQQQKLDYTYAVENAQGFSWNLNVKENEFHFTSSVEQIFGYPNDFFDGTIDKIISIIVEEDRKPLSEGIVRLLEDNESTFQYKCRIRNANNEIIYISLNSRVSNGIEGYIVGVGFDITEQSLLELKRTELVENLQAEQLRSELALEGSKSFSWERIPSRDILRFHKNFYTITGYPEGSFGEKATNFNSVFADGSFKMVSEKLIEYTTGKSEVYSAEYPLICANNEIRWYLTRGKYIDEKKEIMYGVSVDITETKQYEHRLRELAYKDNLTGLYNLQYLTHGSSFGTDISYKNVGAVLIDIRRFKGINDVFGHNFGDQILIQMGKRLFEHPFGDIKARISGDRFLILKENTNEEELIQYVESLNSSVIDSNMDDDQRIKMELNHGLVITKETDIMKILNEAEVALKEAKSNENQNYYLLDDELRKHHKNKFINEFSLQKAIEENQFFLVYQPLIYAETERIKGAEALIRWRHPEYGLIPPLDFIPLAEETGLIIPIGEYVIKEVIKQMRNYLDKNIDVKVSINLSPKQFLSPKLKDLIIGLIKEYNIPSDHLVVEVTESIMISNFENITDTLFELHQNGVLVALDDFGTGYSSMQYLGKLPIDILKLDRIFVNSAPKEEVYQSILESMITMAHCLKLQVIAEGVETEEELQLVKKYGCDIIQGYYYSKPLELEQFEQFVQKFKSR